jgi:hypothetical protein
MRLCRQLADPSMLKAIPVRPMKARFKLAVAWLITLLVSIAVTAVGIAWGKSVDCKAGEVDGQCGLGTFLGLLYGAGAGLAILLGMTVYLLIVAFRRRRTT